MSSNIGTLEQRARIRLWPVVVALIAVTAVAVYFTMSDRDNARDNAEKTATVSGTAANTPSELRGGFAEAPSDTLANTPSELRGGFAEAPASAANGQIGRRNVTPRVGAVVPNANTPSELSGGLTVGGETDAKYHPLP